MDIVIDLEYFNKLLDLNPLELFWVLFKDGGWIIFLVLFLIGSYKIWLSYRQEKYASRWNFILLAVDIPKATEQTPKAVENIFVQLAGALSGANFVEKYILGKFQKSFSFEIISVGGYIQFLIRTEAGFKDLVEAAIYAQYPDAEITEVSDYTDSAPIDYPNDTYQLFGTEYVLQREDPYPIKTYPFFEHPLTQTFLDPMAGLLEVMSKLRPGEQVWLQLVIVPIKDDWKKKGEKLYKDLIGAKVKSKKGLADKVLDSPMGILERLGDVFLTQEGTGVLGGAAKEESGKDEPSKIQYLSPGEKGVVESIESKISKIGFDTKFRMIYIAPKEIFDKARGVAPVEGSIKQFNTIVNGFKSYSKVKTKIDYFFKNYRENLRRNKIIRAYKDRSDGVGAPSYVLNVEELASLYHFPDITVKAPLVKKAESKRAEPPMSLPSIEDEIAPKETSPKTEEFVPEDLPFEE